MNHVQTGIVACLTPVSSLGGLAVVGTPCAVWFSLLAVEGQGPWRWWWREKLPWEQEAVPPPGMSEIWARSFGRTWPGWGLCQAQLQWDSRSTSAVSTQSCCCVRPTDTSLTPSPHGRKSEVPGVQPCSSPSWAVSLQGIGSNEARVSGRCFCLLFGLFCFRTHLSEVFIVISSWLWFPCRCFQTWVSKTVCEICFQQTCPENFCLNWIRPGKDEWLC